MEKGKKPMKPPDYEERLLHRRTEEEIAEIRNNVIAADRNENNKRRTKRPQ